MSKESYARGFVKAAAAAGVDPVKLAKFASDYEDVKRIADTKVNSHPSISDLQELAKIDIRKLPISAYNMTGKDYMDNMKHVAPEFANLWLDYMRNKSSDGQGNGFLKRPMSVEAQKVKGLVGLITPEHIIPKMNGDVEGRALANNIAANYANITNILDKIQQQTGKPLWDVKNVKVPTEK